jgi:hypothetical protein
MWLQGLEQPTTIHTSTRSSVSSVKECATIRATTTHQTFVTSATDAVVAWKLGYTISTRNRDNRRNCDSIVTTHMQCLQGPRKMCDSAMAIRLNGSDPIKRERGIAITWRCQVRTTQYRVVLLGRNQCLANVLTQSINNVTWSSHLCTHYTI